MAELSMATLEVQRLSDSNQTRPRSLTTGWLNSSVHASSLDVYASLVKSVSAQLEKSTGYSKDFIISQQELQKHVLALSTTISERNTPPAADDAQTLKGKIRSLCRRSQEVSVKTCQVILHYQQIFDVLNEQAPEYSTAVWGAIKMMSLVVCNNAEMKEKIEAHLDLFAGQFQSLEILTRYQPSERVQEATTYAMQCFLEFLAEATKFFGENRIKRLTKSIIKPWEIRLAPLAAKVGESIAKVQELARAEFQVETGLALRTVGSMTANIQASLHQYGAEQRLASMYIGRTLESLQNNVGQLMYQTTQSTQSTLPFRSTLELRDANDESIFATADSKSKVPITGLINWNEGMYKSFCAVFPGISSFEQPILALEESHQKSKKGLKGRDPTELSNALQNLERYERVSDWLEEPSSKILWIFGNREFHRFDWMTVFTMRMLFSIHRRGSMCYLYAFCGTASNRSSDEPFSPTRLLQSLIVQLVAQIIEPKTSRILSRERCRELNLTEPWLSAHKDDLDELFQIFQNLLEALNPESLFIIIDNYHQIQPDGTNESAEHGEELTELFLGLEKLTTNTRIVVKLLITSCLPHSPDSILGKRIDTTADFSLKVNKYLLAPPPASVLRHRKFRLSVANVESAERLQELEARLAAGDPSVLDESDKEAKDRDVWSDVEMAPDSDTGSLAGVLDSDESSLGLDSDAEDEKLPLPTTTAVAALSLAGSSDSELDSDDDLKPILRTETDLERDEFIRTLDDSSDDEALLSGQEYTAKGDKVKSDDEESLDEIREMLQASDKT